MSTILAKKVSVQLKGSGVLYASVSAGSAGGGDFTGEVYAGPYEVTPDVEAQALATAQKYMQQDVHIKAIPYYDTGNTAGGRTIYIGKELE